jgi:signal transduction histidine kinase
MLGVASVALRDAVMSYGLTIAGVLVTPSGVVSNTGLPTWSGVRQGLRFPDQVLEVDGIPLRSPGVHGYPARVLDDGVATAARNGKPTVHVKVQTSDGVRELDLTLEPIGSLAWWTYPGVLFFVGAAYLVAGIVAAGVSRAPVARSFSKLAFSLSLFVFVLFDFHTTRALAPFFWLSYPMVPMALVELGLRLPDDVALVQRYPRALLILDAFALLLAVAMMVANAIGIPDAPLAVVTTSLYAISLVFLPVAVTVRFFRATGQRRALLRPMVFTVALPQLLIALRFMMHGQIRAITDMIAFPVSALTPLATMVALARQDIWRSRVMLPRLVTRAVIAGIVCVLAIGFGTAFASAFGVPFEAALVSASAGAVVAAALVLLALRVGDKAFFPSLAEYKPTVEQLSEQLTSIASPEEVMRSVERTIGHWLPCDTIELELSPPAEAEGVDRLTPNGTARAGDGSPPHNRANELVLPFNFDGMTLGWIRVSQKRGGALFTSEDLDLLKTIANQGALALAHAIAYAELERRRKQQAAAWRDEREALVETLSAEIAHEIRYPINFFRSVFQRAASSKLLEEEDLEIGAEEVDRLERLVSGLKRLATQHLERGLCDVVELCDRAEVLLRDRMGTHSLAVDVGDGASVRCDVDKVTQILVNLVANALDATDGKGEVGISWQSGPRGGELSVWDTGPGFEGDPSRLFAPWYTTKERGTGLGLAITYRLVRAHGWTIEATRRAGKTIFVVSVPPGDIVASSDRIMTGEPVGDSSLQAPAEGGDQGVA